MLRNKGIERSFFSLSCIGLTHIAAIETPMKIDPQNDEYKILVESHLRHPVFVLGMPNQKMHIFDRMRHYNVPGVSIAVIHEGKIAWASGYGNIGNDSVSKQVDEHTLFQAGSISKSFTAFGALLLVQQGKMDLDEDVNTYLHSWKIPDNEWTQTEKVTLRRLLSHTAGTSVLGFPGYSVQAPIPSTVEILDGVKPLVNTDPVRVIFQPGSKFQYSAGGTTIVQLLIEEITGLPFDMWMQTNVLTPLGMSDSTFSQPFPPSYAERVAHGHVKDKKVEGCWHVYPEKAAAGLWTNPTDLAKFLLHIQSALKTDKILLLDPALVREMITSQFPNGKKDEPGLGFFINHDGEDLIFGHEGQDEGFITSLSGFAHRRQGAVIMMNQDAGWSLMGEIINSVADTYAWPNFEPLQKKSSPLNTSILNRIKGRFLHESDEIEVTIVGERPYALFKSGSAQPVEMFPEDDHTYFIQEKDLTMEFIAASSGKIKSLILTRSDGEILVFRRDQDHPSIEVKQ